jgi:hypothetical protein
MNRTIDLIRTAYLGTTFMALIVQAFYGFKGLNYARNLAVWVLRLLALQIMIPIVLAMLIPLYPPGSDALEMGLPLFLLLLYTVLIWVFIIPGLFLCAKIFLRERKLRNI